MNQIKRTPLNNKATYKSELVPYPNKKESLTPPIPPPTSGTYWTQVPGILALLLLSKKKKVKQK